jgi:hypothetical protein
LDAHTSVELQFCDMLHGRLARSNWMIRKSLERV